MIGRFLPMLLAVLRFSWPRLYPPPTLISISKLFCLVGRLATLEALLCTVAPDVERCVLESLRGFFLRMGVEVERVRPDEGECFKPQWLGDSRDLAADSRELRLRDTQLESLDLPDSCTGPVCVCMLRLCQEP